MSNYRMYLRMLLFLLGCPFLLIGVSAYAADNNNANNIGVIAHRGYYTVLKDSTQNSLAAFEAALDAGFYGSETDVWMTKDEVLVIYHDKAIDNIVIEDCDYSDIKDLKLSNGESIPTLRDFLDLLKVTNSPTKLIIEIKARTVDRSILAADKIIEMVSSYELQDKVEYISFWLQSVCRVKEIMPNAICSYVAGSYIHSPLSLASFGINIDYEVSIYKDNPTWIQEAHECGLKTNVWTVNTNGLIYDFMINGIDFVTTDNPELATAIKTEIEQQSGLIEINTEHNEKYIYYDINGHKKKSPILGKPSIRVDDHGKSSLRIHAF